MFCASALSANDDPAESVAEVAARVAAGLNGRTADFAVGFVSADRVDSLRTLARACREGGLSRHFLGVTGETIIGDGREIENAPATSLWAACLPEGSRVSPFRHRWRGADRLPPELATPGDSRSLLLLADPFSYPADGLFKSLNADGLGPRIFGGMASASHQPKGNRLALDDEVHDDGAVGLFLEGPFSLGTVVSQGCRPIGRPMIVTKVEGNVIRELGRRPALEVLRETYAELTEDDQELVRHGLHVGRVINEYQETFARGDFLVRNVIGADEGGGIAITDEVRVGQTVQFHVRDSRTADEDLAALLRTDRERQAAGPPAGGLLFSCNGRGRRLFAEPDHDVQAIRESHGEVPIAGFFAMGEFGPVGGKNFVHGYTASLALFGL